MAADTHPHENPHVAHETKDVRIRPILLFGAGLLAVAIVVHLLVALLFSFFQTREARSVAPRFPLAMSGRTQVPPAPRLQTNPRQDLRDLRAAEDVELRTYGWIDQANGVVRIPIDEAMKRVVAEGLPARPAAGAPARPAATSSGDANSGREIGELPQ